MSDLLRSQDELKKSILALLLKLRSIDKDRDLHEMAYILKVANQLGLSEEDVLAVKSSLDSYPLNAPKNEQDRMTILYYLLFLMEIDGQITKSEEQFVQEFGFKLGFRTTLTTELIELIKEHANKKLPPEKMINQIRKYLN